MPTWRSSAIRARRHQGIKMELAELEKKMAEAEVAPTAPELRVAERTMERESQEVAEIEASMHLVFARWLGKKQQQILKLEN